MKLNRHWMATSYLKDGNIDLLLGPNLLKLIEDSRFIDDPRLIFLATVLYIFWSVDMLANRSASACSSSLLFRISSAAPMSSSCAQCKRQLTNLVRIFLRRAQRTNAGVPSLVLRAASKRQQVMKQILNPKL